MSTVDGLAAARWLLALTSIRPGLCLHYVWRAYAAQGATTGRSAPTALRGWELSDGKHRGDRNPPPGVPVWFGEKPGSSAGDVVISLGGGRVACTDYPRYGVTGSCTIDERQRQIGRPYLGWTERIFDQPIRLPAPASAPDPTPEDDMFNIIYAKASDAGTVYEIKNGRKRGVTAVEWSLIKAAYAAAGQKVPYARGTVTAAQLKSIPHA